MLNYYEKENYPTDFVYLISLKESDNLSLLSQLFDKKMHKMANVVMLGEI